VKVKGEDHNPDERRSGIEVVLRRVDLG